MLEFNIKCQFANDFHQNNIQDKFIRLFRYILHFIKSYQVNFHINMLNYYILMPKLYSFHHLDVILYLVIFLIIIQLSQIFRFIIRNFLIIKINAIILSNLIKFLNYLSNLIFNLLTLRIFALLMLIFQSNNYSFLYYQLINKI